LLLQAREILLLEAVLRHPVLRLQLLAEATRNILLLVEAALVESDALLLLADPRLLLLLRQASLLLLLRDLLLADLLLADLLLLRLHACGGCTVGLQFRLLRLLPLRGGRAIYFRLLLSRLLDAILLRRLHLFPLCCRSRAILFRLLLSRLLHAILLRRLHLFPLRCRSRAIFSRLLDAILLRVLRFLALRCLLFGAHLLGFLLRLRGVLRFLLFLRFRLRLAGWLVLREQRSACSNAYDRGNHYREDFLVRACNVHGRLRGKVKRRVVAARLHEASNSLNAG